MRLEDELVAFLRRPLMCILAASGEGSFPTAGRGVGVRVLEDDASVEILFSGWQWPGLEQAIREKSRLAATFVNPSDYEAFQLKGAATMRETRDTDFLIADRFIRAATDELVSLGVSPLVISAWLTSREIKVARLSVNEIYIQTPGQKAGMRTNRGQ